MKEAINKYKEMMKNKYMKSIVFFGFYALFFGFVFLLISATPPQKANNINAKTADKWKVLDNNYEYLYQITMKDATAKKDINITLLGQKYKAKDFYTKYIDTIKDSVVYQIDKSIYVLENNAWVLKDDYIRIHKDFDNTLINLDNIKKMIKDAELDNTITNFDESIDEQYTYGENPKTNIDVTSKGNQISKIEIKTANLYIILQYKNINQIKDFTVQGKDK